MANSKIPSRYIGGHTLRLGAFGAPYFDADGKLKTDLTLHTGDTLMMEEHEIRGDTHIIDPRGVLPAEYLGTGKVVKPEHANLSAEELANLGYCFCSGRADFIEIVPEEKVSQQVDASTQGVATETESIEG